MFTNNSLSINKSGIVEIMESNSKFAEVRTFKDILIEMMPFNKDKNEYLNFMHKSVFEFFVIKGIFKDFSEVLDCIVIFFLISWNVVKLKILKVQNVN